MKTPTISIFENFPCGNPRISPLFLLAIITVSTGATAFDTRAFDIPNSEMDRGK